MPEDMLKFAASMGVGGVLAAFMFMFYRKDVQGYTDLWKSTADQLVSVVKENTSSNTKLIALIESQERNAIRLSDIQAMIENKARTIPFDKLGTK